MQRERGSEYNVCCYAYTLGFLLMVKACGNMLQAVSLAAPLSTSTCEVAYRSRLGSFVLWRSIRIELKSCNTSFLRLCSHDILGILGGHCAVGVLSSFSSTFGLELTRTRVQAGHHIVGVTQLRRVVLGQLSRFVNARRLA